MLEASITCHAPWNKERLIGHSMQVRADLGNLQSRQRPILVN